MNLRLHVIFAAIFAIIFAGNAQAQNDGFAGLGIAVEGFAQPKKNQVWNFPTDHGAHPEYRIEWWYVTANLIDAEGNQYGVQWTLFRSALRPETRDGWRDPQIWMGHAALTSANRHYTAERFARGGVGVAGAQGAPLEVFIDEWQMVGDDGISRLDLNAGGIDFAYDLTLSTDKPLILHGENGYSVKSTTGQASRYYAQPHYQVTGRLLSAEGEIDVTGQAWLDREYSSQPLAPDQQGWDWFSVHLDSGDKVMLFRLRGGTDFYAGTWIAADGNQRDLSGDEFRLTPLRHAKVAGRKVPLDWQLTLPEFGVDVHLTPLNDQAWMPGRFAYWEGPVIVTGSHKGVGYMELTGYE